IGYILLGVALFTELGLTAGIFYLLHHMIVKASLFMSTGAVEVRYGTGAIGALGGISRTEPIIAVAFMIAALSLAGIPPFSGFAAKFMLIVGAVESGQIAAVITMLFLSLITLLSMLKIWTGMFWEKGSGDRPPNLARSLPHTPATPTLTKRHTPPSWLPKPPAPKSARCPAPKPLLKLMNPPCQPDASTPRWQHPP